MSERRAKGCLVATVLWCVILVVLAVGYKFLIHPYLSERLKRETASESQYKEEIVIAADSFSGYAILRSDAVKQDLRAKQIKLAFQDDGGDYEGRLKALQSGRIQMAVFTIDSLIAAGAKAGAFPCSIVMIIDETKGGDAIVAWQSAVTNLQDLNDAEARLVLTPNSPSEFLARVVLAQFNLPDLPNKWWVEADGAREVYAKFLAGRTGKRAYVLWEPYVSRALQQNGAHVLIDSSNLQGYIVDVLVAERQFLRDHPELVRAVLEAHSRAAFQYGRKNNGLAELVREDASRTGGELLDLAQAGEVVRGIEWKNTLENYVHFGLSPAAGGEGLLHLEDIIGNIVDVLVQTKAMSKDPLEGQYHTLFYNQILGQMKADQFYPSGSPTLVHGMQNLSALESVRTNQALEALTAEQWDKLRPVAQLRTEPITFRRASANISDQSRRDLQELARRLQSFPRYYLKVIGHARSDGDAEANRRLARARAEAAARFLVEQGIDADRIRTEAEPGMGAGGEAQSVSFLVGQVPY